MVLFVLVLCIIRSINGIIWDSAGFLVETAGFLLISAGLSTKSAGFLLISAGLPTITTPSRTYSAE
ncbi:hypothetical protein [Rossellomorea sp. DUT-2]|uniref:hypothetical protein n=1 Tax=Rossellomorea sp. DUT-2 TaxID=3412021 RepID=UPI003D16BD3C